MAVAIPPCKQENHNVVHNSRPRKKTNRTRAFIFIFFFLIYFVLFFVLFFFAHCLARGDFWLSLCDIYPSVRLVCFSVPAQTWYLFTIFFFFLTFALFFFGISGCLMPEAFQILGNNFFFIPPKYLSVKQVTTQCYHLPSIQSRHCRVGTKANFPEFSRCQTRALISVKATWVSKQIVHKVQHWAQWGPLCWIMHGDTMSAKYLGNGACKLSIGAPERGVLLLWVYDNNDNDGQWLR